MKHQTKKRFGQHFLVDRGVIQHIIDVLNPKPDDFLVEIGPGQGALTNRVLPLADQLHVIELDRDLIPALHETSRQHNHKLHVHHADVLDVDFSTWKINDSKMRVFGNLPYNISTPLLFHLLKYKNRIRDMTFMVQKEVADRLSARPRTKAYGRLSVMVQYACEVHVLFDVDRTSFSPPPKVQSSVIRLIPTLNPLRANNESCFSEIVNRGFQMRRKTLRNALHEKVNDAFWSTTSMNAARRAETLSVLEWIELSNEIDLFLTKS